MSPGFRVPLPEKLGLSMSATIPNFSAPRSKDFSAEKLTEISERLFGLVYKETSEQTSVKKKPKHEIEAEERLRSALHPQPVDKANRYLTFHFEG